MVVQVVDQKTNSCHYPTDDVELSKPVKTIPHLVDKVVRRVSSVYVADITESITRLSLNAVVIGQERVKNETESKKSLMLQVANVNELLTHL